MSESDKKSTAISNVLMKEHGNRLPSTRGSQNNNLMKLKSSIKATKMNDFLDDGMETILSMKLK